MRRTESDRAEFEQELPRIERHARVHFHDIACPQRRADLIAEAVALSFKWWLRLKRRGKAPERFVSAIATYAARSARSGRRLCGHEKAKDVLSGHAQRLHGFHVGPLPEASTFGGTALAEALIDNTRTPPEEQVCFRIDFPAWVLTYATRERRIIELLMCGERTLDLARRFGVSAARVSQLRRAFHDDWQRFIGEAN